MPWSYDVTELGTSQLYQLRLEIGDTNGDNQLLQDEEINALAGVEGNFWGGAARCCEVIARNLMRDADIRLGRGLYELNTKKSLQYEAMAKALRQKALGTRVPWVGGETIADKETYEQDDSLVQPKFTKDMMQDIFVGDLSSDTGDMAPPTTDQ